MAGGFLYGLGALRQAWGAVGLAMNPFREVLLGCRFGAVAFRV